MDSLTFMFFLSIINYSNILRIKIKSIYVKYFLISTKVRLKRGEHLQSEDFFSCELYFSSILKSHILIKNSKYFFLCLFISVCFPVINKICLHFAYNLFEWTYFLSVFPAWMRSLNHGLLNRHFFLNLVHMKSQVNHKTPFWHSKQNQVFIPALNFLFLAEIR